jgi:predicted DNA-binding transcriptional regulator YafY
MPYKSGEYSATTRRLRLFDYLRGKRLPTPLAELMAEFGVSDDTIRRDLHDIADAGYAIDYSRDDNRSGQTMVLMRSSTFLDVPITREEAHTFAGSRRLWEPLKGTPFYDNFENLYRKVVETLPAKERAEIERDRTRFFCIPDGGVLPYEDKRSVVETLRLGAMNRRQVKYVYRTRGGKYRTGTCEPFAIGVYKNTIYVLARLVPSTRSVASGSPQHLSWVSWPAHRFTEASLLRHEFTVPSTFKLEDHFDGWGIISGDERERVVVEFDAEVAPLISERRWHPSQTIEVLHAGGVRLTCEIANTSEVIAWILSFGSHAAVIEPESLRAEIFREFSKSMERMLARSPTGPEPPRGWQDEGLRVFDAREMRRIRRRVSNDNDAPSGREPRNENDQKSDSQGADEEDGDEWNEADETTGPPPRCATGGSRGMASSTPLAPLQHDSTWLFASASLGRAHQLPRQARAPRTEALSSRQLAADRQRDDRDLDSLRS